MTSSYAPNVGGVEEHVRNVARVLARRGHQPVVWTVAEGAPGRRMVDGVLVRDLPCPLPARSPGPAGRFAVRFPGALRRWLTAYGQDRPDVLHLHCFGPNGTWLRWLTRLVGAPWILSAHGETLADADRVFDSSALLRRSLAAGLREAAAVTGCSRVTLDDLSARFGLEPGRGTVVFNGIDPAEAADPGWQHPQPYVLAVGRVVATKGFDLLLRAFARAEVAADVRLVVAGDGPALAGLRAEAARLGVADRVDFVGRLSRGRVVAAMRDAALLVVPSRVEPFGITVLEGWRAGVPVVATSRGGPPEFVTDGVDGWLVDPGDGPALAARMSSLLAQPQASEVVARAGRAAVQAFTWERVVDRYESLYGVVRAR